MNTEQLNQATQTTLEGMRLCLGRWYDTSGGYTLASIYLHLYNSRDYKADLLGAILDYEVIPYYNAALQTRVTGKEPHQLGGDSAKLMQRIVEVYGKSCEVKA